MGDGAKSDRIGAEVGRRDRSRARPGRFGALRDPVVVVLVLAGFFDGLAGNPVHAAVLIGAALLLVLRPSAEPASSLPVPPEAAPTWEWRSIHPRWLPIAAAAAAAFAVVVGALERYSWPVTVAVLVPGVIALLAAGSVPEASGPEPEIDRAGTWAWILLFVGLAVWELVNFLLQPDRLTGSYDHPTLSTLFNTYATGHPGRSLALFLWLVTGWWLVER
jgi:hypothetical protein